MQDVSKTFSFKELLACIKPVTNRSKLLSLGFGLILISWLLSQLELTATLEVLRNVPISFLFLGFVCYNLGYVFVGILN